MTHSSTDDSQILDKIEEYCKMVIVGWKNGDDYDYYEWKFAKIILDIINENRNEI